MRKRPDLLVATDEQILDFIEAYCIDHGYSPNYREVMRGVGLKSPATIRWRLSRLRDEGKVTYSERIPRTLRVVKQPTDE